MIGVSLGLSGVLALRNQIIERSQTLGLVHNRLLQPTLDLRGAKAPASGPLNSFEANFAEALQSVNQLQTHSSQQAAAYERGENQDIASVMMSRQKAAIAFEATVQVRNRLLSAYREIMNMPV